MRPEVVLDTSALLVWMRGDDGAATVFPRLPGAAVSAASWSEVWRALDENGVDADRTLARLRPLGISVEPVTPDDAVAAARLWRTALPLGARCTVALGLRLGRAVVTAEPAWAGLDLPVAVESVRVSADASRGRRRAPGR